MNKIICTMHGLPKDEHNCLYCCLCFKDLLTMEDCNVTPEGLREDVCHACAKRERELLERKSQ